MRHTVADSNRLYILLFVGVLLLPLTSSWPSTIQVAAAQEPAPLDAAFVSQQVPDTMAKGKTYRVSITMRNAGIAVWTDASGFRLGSQNPQDNGIWNIGRVHLADGERVDPEQVATFVFTVKSPAETGSYNFQWQMLREGVRWFGDRSPNVSIDVVDSLPGPPQPALAQTVPAIGYEMKKIELQQLPASGNAALQHGEATLRTREKPAPTPYGNNLALALADPEYYLPYEPAAETLVPIRDTTLSTEKSWIEISRFIVGDLQRLFVAAQTETGYNLRVRSAYRNPSTQYWLFRDMAREYGPYALLSSARAGHSEHQLGTTVDVMPPGYSFATFPPDLTQWLAANAHRFGFVVSYPDAVPADRFQYRPEPWHLRWVGPALAADVHASGMQMNTYLRSRLYTIQPYQSPAVMQEIARAYGYLK